MTPADDAAEARRRLEEVTEELLGLYEEINVLHTVSEIAARAEDAAAAGRRILDEAVGLLKADVGFIVYGSADLAEEEPEPAGLPREACRRIAELIAPRIPAGATSLVVAPFTEGAGIPRAPEAVLAAPLAVEGERLGLLGLGRRGRAARFTSGDEKIASVLAAQAALVISQRLNLDLKRLARSLSERTAALRGILEISREITSTLDLDRVLRAVADLPARVLGFDRCGVLVEEGGRSRLRALSGAVQVDREDEGVASLESILVWTAARGEPFAARAGLAEPAAAGAGSEEFAERARAHFEVSGMGAILAIPLADDQGTLGALGLEAARAEALSEAAREAALILAHQATVAIRNGKLYRELPFVSLLEPMRRGRRALRPLPRRRLAAAGIGAGLLLAGSVLVPWDLRVPGTFTIEPARRIEVTSRIRGVLREVAPIQEGASVAAGRLLARLDDTDLRLRLNEADWRLRSALREAARLEAEGRAAELALARLEAERWAVERDLLAWKVDQATIRAPAAGVMLTPRLEERLGQLLEVGSVLCALADLSDLRAAIAVPEREADALEGRDDLRAVLKPQAFPERDVEAEVLRIRPVAEIREGSPVLVAEARVEGEPGLRPGMTGEARLRAGRRSLASLAVRGPYRFLRRSLWW